MKEIAIIAAYDVWPFADDELIKRPLWEFPPAARKAVLSERRRRGFVVPDADDFDPIYS